MVVPTIFTGSLREDLLPLHLAKSLTVKASAQKLVSVKRMPQIMEDLALGDTTLVQLCNHIDSVRELRMVNRSICGASIGRLYTSFHKSCCSRLLRGIVFKLIPLSYPSIYNSWMGTHILMLTQMNIFIQKFGYTIKNLFDLIKNWFSEPVLVCGPFFRPSLISSYRQVVNHEENSLLRNNAEKYGYYFPCFHKRFWIE